MTSFSATATMSIRLEVVKRNDDVNGFQALARRWVVERILGWLIRCRRLCRDYERTIAHASKPMPVDAATFAGD
jgi:transposase